MIEITIEIKEWLMWIIAGWLIVSVISLVVGWVQTGQRHRLAQRELDESIRDN